MTGSKIPRRKRVAQFSTSQSKVRVREEIMVGELEVENFLIFNLNPISVLSFVIFIAY